MRRKIALKLDMLLFVLSYLVVDIPRYNHSNGMYCGSRYKISQNLKLLGEFLSIHKRTSWKFCIVSLLSVRILNGAVSWLSYLLLRSED